MKKYLLIFISLLFSGFVFANEDIKISSEKYLEPGTEVKVTLGENIKPVKNIELFVGPEKLEKKAKIEGNSYFFSFKDIKDITPIKNQIKMVVNKDQVYDLGRYLLFTRIDLDNLSGGKEVELAGYFTGSCNLILSDNTSLGLDIRGNYAYVKIPKDLKNNIFGGYVKCGDLLSNWLDFHIIQAPEIKYIISENKRPILPGTTIFIKGNFFKVDDEDDVKLIIGGQEIDKDNFYVMNEHTIKYTLEEKNLGEIGVRVVRNGFESNEIKLSVTKNPYIEKVNTITKNGKNYFRLLGYFPKELGDVKVYYDNKELAIDYITKNYIDVSYPQYYEKDDDFECSFYIKPSYFSVSIGNIKSNKYFYYKSDLPSITSVDKSVCANNTCQTNVYVTYLPYKKVKLLLNGKKVDFSFNGSKGIIYTNDVLKNGDLQLVFPDCNIGEKYYFKLSDRYIPLIKLIKSKNNFRSADVVDIYGDRLNYDGLYHDLNLKVSLNPDILDKSRKMVKGRESVTLFLDNQLIEGTKVSVSLSNIYGNSNGGMFVIGGKREYMGNPYIKYVSYPEGGEGSKKAIIKGINFSNNCSEDEIYFNGKVIYPNKCDYTTLEFIIPKDNKTDKIYVSIDDNKSNEYKLNSEIGGTLLNKKEIAVLSNNERRIFDVQKDSLNQKIKFKITNTTTDLLFQKFVISVKTDSKVLPFYDFSLGINGDYNKYFYSFSQHKLFKGGNKNTGYIVKTDKGYDIVFTNIFIPFSLDPLELSLDFNTNKIDIIDGKIYKFYVKPQSVYYYNLYSEDLKPLRKDFDIVDLAVMKTLNKETICFDSDSSYKNCSLVLGGASLNWKKVQTPSKKSSNTSPSTPQTTNNSSVNQTSNTKKKISKIDKIASRLKPDLMKKINKILYKALLKKKKKYMNTDKKPYLVQMYKSLKTLISTTKNPSFENKKLYVKALISYLQAYKKLK